MTVISVFGGCVGLVFYDLFVCLYDGISLCMCIFVCLF